MQGAYLSMAKPVVTAILAIAIVAAGVVVWWAVSPRQVSVENIWRQPVP
jgi:hypothetical protein